MVPNHTLQTAIKGYLAVLGCSTMADSKHILGSLGAVKSQLQQLDSDLARKALDAVTNREKINHEHSAAEGSEEETLAGELERASQTASQLLLQVLEDNA